MRMSLKPLHWNRSRCSGPSALLNIPYCGHVDTQNHGSDVDVFQVCGLENHCVEACVDAHGCHGGAFGSFCAKCWSYEASYHRGHWKLNSCGLWSQSTKDWTWTWLHCCSPSLPEDKDSSKSQCSNKKLKTCGSTLATLFSG